MHWGESSASPGKYEKSLAHGGVTAVVEEGMKSEDFFTASRIWGVFSCFCRSAAIFRHIAHGYFPLKVRSTPVTNEWAWSV